MDPKNDFNDNDIGGPNAEPQSIKGREWFRHKCVGFCSMNVEEQNLDILIEDYKLNFPS